MPIPISLIVDDPCPILQVYHYQCLHRPVPSPVTRAGKAVERTIPTSFLERFCDTVEQTGLRGKFSIIPAPAWRGDVVKGVDGDLPGTRAWLDVARRRLGGRFDFCPECVTHDYAVDLDTGALSDMNECDWSQEQDRETLTRYITCALALLRDAGIDATGVTSPWVFGDQVEEDYMAAIIAAQAAVYGRRRSWYFLHMLEAHPTARPWVAHRGDDACLVSVPSNTEDVFWKSIDSGRTDAEWVDGMADELLGRDGRSGQIRDVLDLGGWPVILTHWQSLYSNGLMTGLAALRETGRRIGALLSAEVRWTSFTELMDATLEAGTPRPGYLPL
jgi:hypothetical protein